MEREKEKEIYELAEEELVELMESKAVDEDSKLRAMKLQAYFLWVISKWLECMEYKMGR